MADSRKAVAHQGDVLVGMLGRKKGAKIQKGPYSQSQVDIENKMKQSTLTAVGMSTIPEVKKFNHMVDQQINQYNPYYVQGDFTSYAMRKQKQQIDLKRYVDSVIYQALQSHVAAKKKVAFNSNALSQEGFNNLIRLQRDFETIKEMQDFIKDPVRFWVEKIIISNDLRPIKNVVSQFIQKCYLMRKYCIVEGNLIHISALNIKNYSRVNKQTIIPFNNHPSMYIKIKQNGEKSVFHEINNGLYSKKELSKLSAQQKKRILDAVSSYLYDRNINVSKEQIQKKIEQFDQQANESVKKTPNEMQGIQQQIEKISDGGD